MRMEIVLLHIAQSPVALEDWLLILERVIKAYPGTEVSTFDAHRVRLIIPEPADGLETLVSLQEEGLIVNWYRKQPS